MGVRLLIKNYVSGVGQTAPSDISDGSSTHEYPDFPPSPDSWLGDTPTPHRY